MSTSEYNFKKTESWFLNGNFFNVEVKHWTAKGKVFSNAIDFETIGHRWNVYVYVFQQHPFFEKLIENINDNYPFLEELHYGCTYSDWSRDENGNVKVKKYGSDYMHLHDEHFENCDNENHPAAREIFFDAERLFDSFKESEDGILQ